MQTFPPGTTLGPYVLDVELARGGMGAVYRARRAQDGAVVALKVLSAGPSATPEQLLRFRREGEVAARLSHPGIVRMHDAGAVSWLCYLAMDLIEGDTLADRVGRLGPLDAARLVAEVARALEHAHAHGVVHRDLKPSNVLLRRDDGRALVTDFGVARDLESATLTRTGALVGTPAYVSPEQAAGRPATAASDVHALGALLFELLAGVPPFRQDDLHLLLNAIASERPSPPSALAPGVPPALDRACLDALAKDPAARPSAGALAARLEAIAAGAADAPPTRRRWAWLAAASIAVAAAALAATSASRVEPPSTVEPVASVSTRRAPRPPPKVVDPPFVEPAWLRAITSRGDTESLLGALRALGDDEQAIDPRARERGVQVLAALDARWTPPSSPDAGEQFDHLLWLHWLWHRLDPTHLLPPHRLHAIEGNAGWSMGQERDERYLPRVASALLAIAPSWPNTYLLYANNTNEAPWTERDGALLRKGVEVASACASRATWGTLAMHYVRWLLQQLERGDVAQARAARAGLLQLARDPTTWRGELDPSTTAMLLRTGASVAEPDEARALLDRADALIGPSAPTAMARAALLARTGDTQGALAEAASGLDRAGESTPPNEVAACATMTAELALRAGQRERALAALARGFEASGPRVPHAGLAMRRVLLLAEGEASAGDLAAALDDLVARLTVDVDRSRRPDRSVIVSALDDALAAAGPRPPVAARVAQQLSRWREASVVRQLDPPSF